MLKVYCMSYPSWRLIWWCWWIQEGISLVVSFFSNLNVTIKQWQDYSNVLNAGSFSFCITTQNKSCEQLKVTLPIDRNKEVSFFSSYIKKKKDDIKPKIIPVYAPLSPIEIDTSAISEVEDITTQPTGEDQIRQETRSLKNQGVDDIECIFFSCIFSNVSRLLVYFILPKVLEV